MYIVNVSFMVSPAAHGKWYEFVLHKFIPALKNDPRYGKITFSRVISSEVESFFTYSLQIRLADIPAYKAFTEEGFPEYQEFAAALFDAEVTYFISMMKIIETE